jgi:hypothetical protein
MSVKRGDETETTNVEYYRKVCEQCKNKEGGQGALKTQESSLTNSSATVTTVDTAAWKQQEHTQKLD